MPMFRKKPVVIEAILFTEDSRQEIINWSGARDKGSPWCGIMDDDGCWVFETHGIRIDTLEGVLWVKPGDWIIKVIKGEFYPCKPDIFDATYEAAD